MSSRVRTYTVLGVLSLFSLFASVEGADQAKEAPALNPVSTSDGEISQVDLLKVSEAFGHFIGRNLNSPGVKFDLESIIKGMREGAAGKPAPMSDKEYEDKMALLQEKAIKALSETNLKDANEFLVKNAKTEEIVILQPGKLQYVVLTPGTGATVVAHSTPKINYTGKYIDGSIFGSSEDTNGPIAVPLDQTIPGFSEGIVGMKEGEKRRLFVHPDLGYGTAGHLPPNSLLIFDIELVKADAHDHDSADEEDEDDLPPLALADEGDDNNNIPNKH